VPDHPVAAAARVPVGGGQPRRRRRRRRGGGVAVGCGGDGGGASPTVAPRARHGIRRALCRCVAVGGGGPRGNFYRLALPGALSCARVLATVLVWPVTQQGRKLRSYRKTHTSTENDSICFRGTEKCDKSNPNNVDYRKNMDHVSPRV